TSRGALVFTFIAALLCFIGVALSTLAVESSIFAFLPSRAADLSTSEQESMQIGGAVGSAACMAIFQACAPSPSNPESYLSAFATLSIVMTCIYVVCLALSWIVVRAKPAGEVEK
ncbi:MAG: hypothetical protein J6O91_02710, partial [Aeriscardovia sp.]|nr:hypothetical protein [Aeriscardovia sp.]